MKTITEYYNSYSEHDRISHKYSIERIRTQSILDRYIHKNCKSVIDIGGGTGIHSFYLADKGYDVSLVDFVLRHIELAKKENKEHENKLKDIIVGDACNLSYKDNTFDVALLFGPLYHLCNKAERITAIQETMRVLKYGGIAFFAIISRFASLLDGYKYDLINDPKFREILNNDIKSGNHLNKTENLHYFMDTFFHSIDDIRIEVKEAGFSLKKLIAVEGFSNALVNIEAKMADEQYRNYLLKNIQETEEDTNLLGISSHVIGIIEKSQI
jgi:ubiquinone/menaquinone biosynthesis C-methylase UbiE